MTTDPHDVERTPPWHSAADTPGAAGPLGPGRVVGRYRLEGILGEGTYGRVYLARHEVLRQRVAVKVLHHRHGSGSQEIRAFLNEALILADLDHPGIVRVIDAGWTEDGLYYIVSKYVAGSDLGQLVRARRLAPRESAGIIEAVAGALHYAHTRGLVHRDIKPANILIDSEGKPCLADFGVALRDRDFGRGARLTGTPAYMSPEQARGESHRVDGRSDVFSLGVVLYELLTAERPFRGETREALQEQIVRCQFRPPRQIDGGIPVDLERACLKAMAKWPGERYQSAGDMAVELSRCLGGVSGASATLGVVGSGRPQPGTILAASTREYTPTWATPLDGGSRPQAGRIIPRGLRSFEAGDADFFPDLLPGPRDHNGLPECIASWRSRIEGGADDTFRMGLIFGRSGVGKTSLVKAGLLPRLSGRILRVYTEASAQGTESRLLEGIRRRCPGLVGETSLAATLEAIRKGTALPPGRKMLLVLDRFERWLQVGRGRKQSALLAALLQCDGEHLQAIAVVRDDAWVAASRFMRDLDDRIVEGENAAAVEPFDLGHARRVLEWFGRAYGALPAGTDALTPDQEHFLDRAVSELAESDQVLPIRLSLFAEAVRRRSWMPRTIEAIGTSDVIFSFLEEVFDADLASPEWRCHHEGARSVLAALLPDHGADAEDGRRSHHELLAALSDAPGPADFETILRTLTADFGIVARVEAHEVEDGPGDPTMGRYEAHYRLAHDFLVTPLRAWLTREAASDRRSRNEFSTAERVAPQALGRVARSRRARALNAANGPPGMGRPMDINEATEDELKTLAGIGPTTARRMIEGRPYRTVDDLLRIKGMSRTRLSQIRPFVALG